MVPSRGVRRGRAESAGGRPCRAVRSQRENGNGSVDRVSRRGAVLRARRQLQGARRLRDLPGGGGAAGEQSRRGADAGEVLMTEADGGGQGRTGSDKSIRRVSLAIIGAGALVVSSASVRLRPPSLQSFSWPPPPPPATPGCSIPCCPSSSARAAIG